MKYITSVTGYGGLVLETWESNDGFIFRVTEDEEKKIHIAIKNDIGYCTGCIFERFIKKHDNYEVSFGGCMPPKIRCKKSDSKAVMDLLESIDKSDLYYEDVR